MSLSRRLILSSALLVAGGSRSWASLGPLRPLEGPVPNVADATPPAPAPATPPAAAGGVPAWRRNAIAAPVTDGRPAITIVIDDMGWMHPLTERAAALPGPLTLSWFPFAPRLPEQVAAAMARGHETMLHMPMQAGTNSTLQTGPDPLRVDLPHDVNLARLKAALAAVPNIVGLNNHMGTVATRDPVLMDIVAAETRDQGLLFLDSITIPHSVALSRAEAAGVPAAGRDVFIDWRNDPKTIATQLAEIETIARKHGHCIAIGHPRPHTMEGLEAWLPTLKDKGFALWPMSATVAWRNNLPMTPLHVS
jgi:polysaccharide deacetylase 2 family uncharacterized protein YibQ